MTDTGHDDNNAPEASVTNPSAIHAGETAPDRTVDGLAFAAATLSTLAVYLCTLTPGLTLGFSGVFAVGAQYMGVPHPPGYPLWTVYSWFIVKLLPFGDSAWRTAVASAVAASLACGVVAWTVSGIGGRLARKAIPGMLPDDRALRVISGAVAGMGLGFNRTFWGKAVVADPWPFSLLLFAIALCLLSRWHFSPKRRCLCFGAFFFYGLALANSQELVPAVIGLMLFLIPPALRDWRHGASGTILAVAAMGLGLSTYLLLPAFSAANPPVNWGYPRMADGFVHTVTRGQYERLQPSPDVATWLRQLFGYAKITCKDVGVPYLIAALIPAFFLRRLPRPQRTWLLHLTAVSASLSLLMVALLNPAADKASHNLIRAYYTASHLVIVILSGCGLMLLARSISADRRANHQS